MTQFRAGDQQKPPKLTVFQPALGGRSWRALVLPVCSLLDPLAEVDHLYCKSSMYFAPRTHEDNVCKGTFQRGGQLT